VFGHEQRLNGERSIANNPEEESWLTRGFASCNLDWNISPVKLCEPSRSAKAEVSAGGKMTPYDDEYPTCKRTFATLRIYSDAVSTPEITARLQLEPTDCFNKGDATGSRGLTRKFNGWFLSSESIVSSRDTRRHLDWLISKIGDKATEIARLHADRVDIDISCFWVYKGQGGPLISPPQMAALSALNIEVWWDVYYDHDSADASSCITEVGQNR
jgi:hypothetical protein